jgi:hypothetical protein
MIRIRFVTGADAISAAIRAAEYGFWASRADAVMPDGTLLGAHYDGGVQARAADYDREKFTRELIVSTPASPEITDAFHSFLRAQLGKPYDIEAIAAFVANRDWRQPDSWFCSESQAAALPACTWFPSTLATEFNHITPRDLLLSVSGRIAINPQAICGLRNSLRKFG